MVAGSWSSYLELTCHKQEAENTLRMTKILRNIKLAPCDIPSSASIHLLILPK